MKMKIKILFVFMVAMLNIDVSFGNELRDRIRQVVLDLEYPESVAGNFVRMVSNWKDSRGRFILELLAREEEEEKTLGLLGQEIRNRISYRNDYFDLTKVIEELQANCFGFAQVFYILGRSFGLNVSVIRLTLDHVANIVRLSDGTMIVVDLLRPKFFVSESITIDGNPGNWIQVDKNHITRDDKIICILDEKDLLAEIYFCQGTVRYLSGQAAEAIPFLTKAIALSPRCARAYNNRGGANLALEKQTEAIFDFNKAIELDSKYASAYNNRASAYLFSGQYSKAILDYKKAIELNPKLDRAYKGLEIAERERERALRH